MQNIDIRRVRFCCQKPLPALPLHYALHHIQHHREVMSSANKLFSCFASKIETHHPCFEHNNITLTFRSVYNLSPNRGCLFSLTTHQTKSNAVQTLTPKPPNSFPIDQLQCCTNGGQSSFKEPQKRNSPHMIFILGLPTSPSPSCCSIMCPRYMFPLCSDSEQVESSSLAFVCASAESRDTVVALHTHPGQGQLPKAPGGPSPDEPWA